MFSSIFKLIIWFILLPGLVIGGIIYYRIQAKEKEELRIKEAKRNSPEGYWENDVGKSCHIAYDGEDGNTYLNAEIQNHGKRKIIDAVVAVQDIEGRDPAKTFSFGYIMPGENRDMHQYLFGKEGGGFDLNCGFQDYKLE